MNEANLRQLKPIDLLRLLEHQLILLRSAIINENDFNMFTSDGPTKDGPLIALGDFEIWARFKDPVECYEDGAKAMPQITVIGPNHPRETGTRHFCCVGCFWKWIDRVIKSRESGGLLNKGIDWAGRDPVPEVRK